MVKVGLKEGAGQVEAHDWPQRLKPFVNLPWGKSRKVSRAHVYINWFAKNLKDTHNPHMYFN